MLYSMKTIWSCDYKFKSLVHLILFSQSFQAKKFRLDYTVPNSCSRFIQTLAVFRIFKLNHSWSSWRHRRNPHPCQRHRTCKDPNRRKGGLDLIIEAIRNRDPSFGSIDKSVCRNNCNGTKQHNKKYNGCIIVPIENSSSVLRTYISNISSKFKSSPSSSSGSALTLVKEALGLKEADGAKAATEERPTTKRLMATENFILLF